MGRSSTNLLFLLVLLPDAQFPVRLPGSLHEPDRDLLHFLRAGLPEVDDESVRVSRAVNQAETSMKGLTLSIVTGNLS